MRGNKSVNIAVKCKRCRVVFWGILALSVLSIVVVILYQNLFFHNLWIRLLPGEKVQTVTIRSKMTGTAVPVSAEDVEEFLALFKKTRLIYPIVEGIPVDNGKPYPDFTIVFRDETQVDIWHYGTEYEEPWNFFYRLDGTVYYASGIGQTSDRNSALGNQLAELYNKLHVKYKSTLAEIPDADGMGGNTYEGAG